MPEGPSILHLRNKLVPFIGKKVKEAGGYGPMPTDWINGKKLLNITTWGKHLLFVFNDGIVRVHLMLFGRIMINEQAKVNRSFYLVFANGEINGYVVKAEKLTGTLEENYDWRLDVMSEQFDASHIKELLKKHADKPIDDLLMDQNIFAGVGNKTRNEALYRAGIHPESITGKIPPVKVTKLINEVVKYSALFYKNLETTGVNNDFTVYKQAYAPDGSEVTMKVLPKSKRKIYFSEHKQKLYK